MKIWPTRILLLIVATLYLLSFCSCWNYKEIDKLAIISTAALDLLPNGQYQLTVEIMNIRNDGKTQLILSKYAQAEGTTIFEAERNLIIKLGKDIYWAHAKAFIFSKIIAEKGIVSVIDWLERSRAPRLDIAIFISNENTASELVKTQAFLHNSLGTELFEISKLMPKTKNPTVNLFSILININSKGKSIVVPVLEFDKKTPNEERRLICNNTAIFKNAKMIGLMDLEDTKSFKLINGDFKNGVVSNTISINEQSTIISMSLLDSSRKTKLRYDNGNITIEIRISTQISLNEIMGSLNITDEKTMKEIKQQCDSYLSERLSTFIQKMQTQYSTDIFGFGEIVMKQHPRVFRNYEKVWNEQFSKTNFMVISDVKIIDTGFSIDSLKERD